MEFSFLHTNDLHGSLSEARLARLLELRPGADFYFDSGDCIKTGNLGVPMQEEAVWSRLDTAKCTASVIGNRETHLSQAVLEKKLKGTLHPVLCANLYSKDGSMPLPATVVITHGQFRIGVLGVSVAMVTERMAARHCSAFIWKDPVQTALALAPELKRDCDCVIALTHIGLTRDMDLARRCRDIDIILGGHSHHVLEEPMLVEGTWICHDGHHAHHLGRYNWKDGTVTGSPKPWQ